MTSTAVIENRAGSPAYAVLVVILLIAMVAALLVSVDIGYAPLNVAAAARDVLRGHDTLSALVLLQLRVPRAVLGALVGFSLGITGAAMQGLLRNPLADPGITGVTSAASLGAVVVFYFGLANLMPLALPLGGIAGAALSTVLLYGVAGSGASTTTLILAGVALSSFFGALTTLALNLSPNPYAVSEIIFWLLGSLSDRSLQYIWLVAPLMVAGWLLLLMCGPALDGLSLGEDTATSLGFRLSRIRLLLIAGTALSVGSAVAATGSIAFIGLVVPHLLRPLVGHRPSRLLLVSGLGGATLTLLADIIVRLLPIRPELKLGVVTALIGAPFLFHLIWRLRHEDR
ncbi:MAG: iron ABC transporter permease [Bradyrhizobium sp.]|nr:iron ABC transporter permease [Bradyrhizobium sp.]